MKDKSAVAILLLLDVVAIAISIALGYQLRIVFDDLVGQEITHGIELYLSFPLLYVIPLMMLVYEGVYSKRHDFWQESRLVLKALVISLVIIFAILALTKEITFFSRLVIIFSIGFMAFLIPLFKNVGKKQLYKMGLWKRSARVYGCDVLVRQEVFKNHYLGYVDAKSGEADTVFINGKDVPSEERNQLIAFALKTKREVVFIPAMDEFDLTKSHVDKLQNTQTNLIYFQNRLACFSRKVFQEAFNYALAILLLPVLLPVIAILAFLIKKESSGPVFFAHNRIGRNGKVIPTFKFRSMFSDAGERLEKLLEEDEAIREEWEKNFKLKDDPRVTKIGAFLRKTSLDELPQIFNVLKGEMNFVGPRPVVQKELEQYYKEDTEYYYMVKPGITGLWQVSGRSDTDYDFRIKTDKWYVMNWSLWLDIVILFKTVKVVLFREGAY